MARNNKAINSLKDVEMEGQSPSEIIARHQAYMNRVNAEAKSLQQTINYAVSLGQHDKFKRLVEELRLVNTELGQAWLDHLALIAKFQNPSRG